MNFEASEKQDLTSNGIQFLEEVFKQGSIISKGQAYFSKNPDGEKMGCDEELRVLNPLCLTVLFYSYQSTWLFITVPWHKAIRS